MNELQDSSGIKSLVRGNELDAREMRRNLALFARHTKDANVRKMVAEVLAGRRNVREIFRTREFNDVAEARLSNLEAGLSRLTDEQRSEVWNQNRPYTPPETLDALMQPYDVSEQDQGAQSSSHVDDWDEDDFSQNSFMR